MDTGIASISPADVRANRFDVLQRVADDLAHEVKNPLHAMVINLELIRRRISSDADADALARVDVVEAEIGRTNRLVEALFLLMRPGRDTSTWSELAGIFTELAPLLEAIAKARRITIHVEAPPDGCVVPLPRASLRHALLNLTLNAVDAVGPGGRVEIESRDGDRVWCIVVRDDGAGIPAEAAERIGTPGFTTRPGHAGLGIAVARLLVEEAGGKVEVEPCAGSGATVTLSLPRGTAA